MSKIRTKPYWSSRSTKCVKTERKLTKKERKKARYEAKKFLKERITRQMREKHRILRYQKILRLENQLTDLYEKFCQNDLTKEAYQDLFRKLVKVSTLKEKAKRLDIEQGFSYNSALPSNETKFFGPKLAKVSFEAETKH